MVSNTVPVNRKELSTVERLDVRAVKVINEPVIITEGLIWVPFVRQEQVVACPVTDVVVYGFGEWTLSMTQYTWSSSLRLSWLKDWSSL